MPESTRQVLDRLLELFITNDFAGQFDLYAEDAVLEGRFTGGTGEPSRIDGRAAIKERITAAATRTAIQRTAIRDLVVHETADPEVIIAEYDMDITVPRTGKSLALRDVLVLRVRNGQIAEIRAYADQARIAAVVAEAAEPANS